MTNRHKDIYIEYKKYIIYIINMQVIIAHTHLFLLVIDAYHICTTIHNI